MAEKLKGKYGADPKHAKYCYGVASHPIVQFDDPNRAFPIAAVYTQLGFREKLADRIAKKILGDSDYGRLQLEWIEPLVPP